MRLCDDLEVRLMDLAAVRMLSDGPAYRPGIWAVPLDPRGGLTGQDSTVRRKNMWRACDASSPTGKFPRRQAASHKNMR